MFEKELESLQKEFGGTFLNQSKLRINRFCSIEKLDNKYKMTSIIYGVKNEICGSKDKMLQILYQNI